MENVQRPLAVVLFAKEFVDVADFTFRRAFAKLRKATFSFVMPVRPFAWNNSAPTGQIVHEI
jgi:hypothetical protein